MDMSQLNLLTDEQKSLYMRLSRVFGEPGWNDLVQTYEEKVQACVTSGANAGTWEENRYYLGLRHAYEEIVGLEAAAEEMFSGAAETEMESQEDRDEEIYE